jgi:hypothetical protein
MTRFLTHFIGDSSRTAQRGSGEVDSDDAMVSSRNASTEYRRIEASS